MAENREATTPAGPQVSRRTLLKSGPLLGGLALVGCAPTQDDVAVPAEQDVHAPDREPTPPPATPEPEVYRFFTEEEVRAIDAAVARIIPGDDDDPGAVQAGVTAYIDAKLARFETFAEPTYLQAPFAEGYEGRPPEQTAADTVPIPEDQLYRYGHQSRLTAQEVYQLGVPALDRYSQTRFGSLFADLPEDRQDQILMVLDGVQQRRENTGSGSNQDGTSTSQDGSGSNQDGTSTSQDGSGGGPSNQQMDQAEDVFGDVGPGEFFTTLREDTIEGMFADPAYGGNRDLAGWRLIGYPGAQRSYSPEEMMHGTNKQPQPMHGLTPMNPDRPGGGRTALVQPRRGVGEG